MPKGQAARDLARSVLIITLLFTAACAEVTSRHELSSSRSQESNQGPFGEGSSESRPVGVPSNIAQANQRVAIILGPGGYKTFAEVGVIKELLKAQVPIGAVVGVEWGSLVGALFAQHGQIHEAEWKLYKLEQLDLNSTSFFSSWHKTKPISELSEYLSQNIENIDVGQTKLPFSCPSLSVSRGTVELQTKGMLPQAIKNCLPMLPLFTPSGDNVAAVLSLPDLVSRLRGEGYKIIILVNVLGEGDLFTNSKSARNYSTMVLWDEVRRQIWKTRAQVTDVIDVNTQGVSMDDFGSRKLLVTEGEAAGEKAAQSLSAKYGF